MTRHCAGRPRVEWIRREMRRCAIHGLTEFSGRSRDKVIQWDCMACHAAESQQYRDEVRAGLRIPGERREPLPPPICKKCHMALPKTGQCDYCD